MIIGLELLELEFFKLSLFQLIFIFPLVSVWVVSLRVHRGVDIFAAIMAAICSTSISKSLSESVDMQLTISIKEDEEKNKTDWINKNIKKSFYIFKIIKKKIKKKVKLYIFF